MFIVAWQKFDLYFSLVHQALFKDTIRQSEVAPYVFEILELNHDPNIVSVAWQTVKGLAKTARSFTTKSFADSWEQIEKRFIDTQTPGNIVLSVVSQFNTDDERNQLREFLREHPDLETGPQSDRIAQAKEKVSQKPLPTFNKFLHR